MEFVVETAFSPSVKGQLPDLNAYQTYHYLLVYMLTTRLVFPLFTNGQFYGSSAPLSEARFSIPNPVR
jgi:hypothetical protein